MPQLVKVCSRIRRLLSLSSTTRTLLSCNSELLESSLSPSSNSVSTVKKKVEPLPFELIICISPPIFCASIFEIVKPSPVPPNLRVVVVSACVNALNNLSCCSSLIPMPVSRTENLNCPDDASFCKKVSFISTSPASVNLIAFPNKLTSICFSLTGSTTANLGIFGLMFNRSSRPFFAAWYLIMSVACSTSSIMSVLIRSSSILPASIFEKSSMSLIIPSNEMPEILAFSAYWS